MIDEAAGLRGSDEGADEHARAGSLQGKCVPACTGRVMEEACGTLAEGIKECMVLINMKGETSTHMSALTLAATLRYS